MEEHFRNSSYREKLVEHLFVGELLKESWKNKGCSLELSKPDVDNAGYDLIAEANGIIRHVQLKTAFLGAKTANQKVNIALAEKVSGCVVWIFFDQDSLELGPYLFFGGKPGQKLPNIDGCPTAKHTKGDSKGYKAERPNIRVIKKGLFKTYSSIPCLYAALFVGT